MRRSHSLALLVIVVVAVAGAAFGQNLPKLPADITMHKSADSPGTVTFRHTSHMGDRPDCTRCHPKLFPIARGASQSATPKITHAQMEKGGKCGACHNGKAAFGFDNCTVCHQ
jgi:c(7)-type cytochrome triheme protein